MKKSIPILFLILTIMTTQAQIKLQTAPPLGDAKNPLLEKWDTPYQTPPFKRIKPEHYVPAFKAAIQMGKEDINSIKQNKVATFQNTIVALDRAGELVTRASGIFFNLLECDATPEMQDIATKVQPMLTEYSNSIYLDTALFHRVKYVYEHEYKKLKGADQMLLKKTYEAFLDNGANLNDKDKKLFNSFSMELSNLTLLFGQNALAATNSYQMQIKNKKELAGLPDNELAIAAQRAKDKGVEGYLFDLSHPSVNAILTYADNRELRKEMYMHSCNKAFGGEYDNCSVIRKILTCREKIAMLLGYPNYAEYALHNRMAKDSKQVYNLLNQLRDAALPVANQEMKSLTKFAHANGLNGDLQRWDFAYYSEKQKNELYDLNTEMLKPYFPLESVIKGVFELAGTLYDLRFEPALDVNVYHPDVTAYYVYRGDQFMAVLYLDFHPRATKRSGAWMTNFREQYQNADGEDIRPLVSLVMNFTPASDGQPSLLSFSEVTTFLHEFGHALNGMLSEVPYASISGTNSPRDFVELPSQLNENWATEPEFLQTFAYHYKTGEPIPEEYIERLKKMRQYLAGYSCLRQLSFGYLDMMYHTTPAPEIKDIQAKELSVFKPLDVMPTVSQACMSTSFSHIFAGGYAAGYYGYKWAEMLEADAFSVFQENGVMDRETANRYVETILSKGGSEDAMDMFVRFRGRKPEVKALLLRDGLK
jgi:peptidyl-dipeptidase Dcp